MRQTTGTGRRSSEKIVKDIKRATRKQYSSEEKIRIVLDGLRGEDSIAELCRREGISQGVYYKWSKDFMEAGKKVKSTLCRTQADVRQLFNMAIPSSGIFMDGHVRVLILTT